MTEYTEGYCEVCENFAQLEEENGQLVCSECLGELSAESEDDEDS
jgi:hypothetical protein